MNELLIILQIIISLILIGFVLIQVKGTGFGRVWGGDSVSFKRRGLEKLVFRLTFFMIFAFIGVALVQLFI